MQNKLEPAHSLRTLHPGALTQYSEKHPFHEETETMDTSAQGCSLLLETAVARGQRLYLVNTNNQDGQECRVVRMGKPHVGKRQVAAEFLRAAPKFWLDS